MKTPAKDLTGIALRWAVASIEMKEPFYVEVPAWADAPTWLRVVCRSGGEFICPRYEDDWASAGPIIEREQIRLAVDDGGHWWADMRVHQNGARAFTTSFYRAIIGSGATPLAAAMRCYVASKLGDEVDIPEELT